MAQLISAAAGRCLSALRLWPDLAQWRITALISGLVIGSMLGIGLTTGLYAPQAAQPGLAMRLIRTLFVPAIGEEAIFRGLLAPCDRTRHPWRSILLVNLLYVAWHPLEALTFMPGATVFLRPDFLACTFILGMGCGWLRWKTGSLWPPIILHWLLVVIWQTWLGGTGLESFR